MTMSMDRVVANLTTLRTFARLVPAGNTLEGVINQVIQGCQNAQVLQLYLDHSFKRIEGYPLHWPTSPADVDMIFKRTGCFVDVASTLARYARNPLYPPQLCLQAILAAPVESGKGNPHSEVDRIYLQVLQNAVFGDEDEARELAERVRMLLGVFVVLKESPSVRALADLCASDPRTVSLVLAPLSTILIIPPEECDLHIQVLHPSFLGFLADPTRCTDPRFLVEPARFQTLAATRCLEIMLERLHYNMCGLSLPTTLESNVDSFDDHARNHITASLSYACRYWASHVTRSSPDNQKLVARLRMFVSTKILHLIEAASLLQVLPEVMDGLRQVITWCSDIDGLKKTVETLRDTLRLCTAYYPAISVSAMHLYHSGIALLPQHALRRLPRIEAPSAIQLVSEREVDWSATLVVIQGTHGPANCVAFSPDGLRVATGFDTGAICVWDASTGTKMMEIDAHGAAITSLVFSADGSQLVSGSLDDTARVWDARSGSVIAQLEGHDHTVNAVAFCLDGSRIASGSSDRLVCLWDPTKEAAKRAEKLFPHPERVASLASSRDGSRLASGSYDDVVRVWDVEGDANTLELKGHHDTVSAIAFSPDGSRLASGSHDDSVRIWDAASGASVAVLSGHTHSVNSVAYSPDGAHIASASSDHSVAIWHAHTLDKVRELRGHTRPVLGVAFAPDGARLATASEDETVRIWDAHAGAGGAGVDCHAGSVDALAFSPDGSLVASGSFDNAILLWDARTGRSIARLEGHTRTVTSLAFHPDSFTLLSRDRTGKSWLWSISADGCTSHELDDAPAMSRLPAPFEPERTFKVDADGWLYVDTPTRSRLCWLPVNRRPHANTVASSLDGNMVAIGSANGIVTILRVLV